MNSTKRTLIIAALYAVQLHFQLFAAVSIVSYRHIPYAKAKRFAESVLTF